MSVCRVSFRSGRVCASRLVNDMVEIHSDATRIKINFFTIILFKYIIPEAMFLLFVLKLYVCI